MPDEPAIDISGLNHAYGDRQALRNLSLQVEPAEIFVFLGPNGGGKTTLFRILSTLMPAQQGEVRVLGFDLRRQPFEVRRRIGVVFQAPGLDKKLTVAENLRHQAALYGLTGAAFLRRRDEMLDRLRLTDRLHDRVETLSGGLRRRVELAKGLLHSPSLLLLDEPSTGLDPGARSDVWTYLQELRDQGVTVALTTHLLEEADKADRIAILHQGSLVALDTPNRLRSTVGGDSITIQTAHAERLARAITDRLGVPARVLDDAVRLELSQGQEWIARLVEAFPGQIDTISLAKPTLEDVFIARTGHRFWRPEEAKVG